MSSIGNQGNKRIIINRYYIIAECITLWTPKETNRNDIYEPMRIVFLQLGSR